MLQPILGPAWPEPIDQSALYESSAASDHELHKAFYGSEEIISAGYGAGPLAPAASSRKSRPAPESSGVHNWDFASGGGQMTGYGVYSSSASGYGAEYGAEYAGEGQSLQELDSLAAAAATTYLQWGAKDEEFGAEE